MTDFSFNWTVSDDLESRKQMNLKSYEHVYCKCNINATL